MKAKSRLKLDPPSTPEPLRIEDKPAITHSWKKNHTAGQKEILWKYLHHLKTFILSLPFYAVCFYILQNISPSQVKNTLIPNLYLPFQLCLFLGNLFFFSFLFLNTRRGFMLTLLIQIFVFLKLQSVLFTWQLVVAILMVFVIIEVVQVALLHLSTKARVPERKHTH
jgi:hypothetical protein